MRQRILVIEDQEDNRQILRDLLAHVARAGRLLVLALRLADHHVRHISDMRGPEPEEIAALHVQAHRLVGEGEL